MTCYGNWICFKCRVSTRRQTWRGITAARPETIGMTDDDVLCRICNDNMRFIGPTIQVPAKSKTKDWKQLEIDIHVLSQALYLENRKQKVERRHGLEKRIADLKSRPENEGRNVLIKEYERFLAELT